MGSALPPRRWPNTLLRGVIPSLLCAVRRTRDPVQVAREFLALGGRLRNPGGGLVFVAGALGSELPRIQREIAAGRPGFPLLLAGGLGVFSSEGDFEHESASAMVIWNGGKQALAVGHGASAQALGHSLGRDILEKAGSAPRTVFLACHPDTSAPAALLAALRLGATDRLFGASTVGDWGPLGVDAWGQSVGSAAVALVMSGPVPARIGTSPGARLLTPLLPMTKVHDRSVLGVSDKSPLDLINAAGAALGEQSVLLAALSTVPPASSARPEFFLSTIDGIDPGRGALVLSTRVREGMYLGIAVQDPVAAREDLESTVRHLRRESGGGMPRFGVLVADAGRVSASPSLGGMAGRIMRGAFPGVPLVGLSSSYQLSPHGGEPRVHVHSAVLALFASPS